MKTLIVKTAVLCAGLLSVVAARAQTLCAPLQANAVVDCVNSTAQLSVNTSYTSYVWAPAAGLSSSNIPNPVASVAGTYSVTATYNGPNLIVNPDFSAGNTGFSSGMVFSTIYSPCNYWVGPQWFQNYYPGLTDHTPTADNMFMMIDGCLTPRTLWQTSVIPVVSGADYKFSFWATEAATNQPTYEIHFIGDVTGDVVVGTQPGIPAPNNNTWAWDQYGIASWNAGANSSVSIRIVNLATMGYGVDFGMDDFDFHRICTGTDVVSVWFPPSVDLGPDTTLCDVTTAILDAGTGGTYLWNTGETTQTIHPAAAGTYWVNFDNGICITSDTIVVSNLITEVVSLGDNIMLCDVDSVVLDAGQACCYLWSTGETTRSITPSIAGTYYVTSGIGACSSTDTIELIGTIGASVLFIPNAITPDGNTRNDVFVPYGADLVKCHMCIYDRWGELLFETSDPATGWNGMYKGKVVQEGSYVYVIEYTTMCNSTTRKRVGYVNVLR